jgi:hypothetical protein
MKRMIVGLTRGLSMAPVAVGAVPLAPVNLAPKPCRSSAMS